MAAPIWNDSQEKRNLTKWLVSVPQTTLQAAGRRAIMEAHQGSQSHQSGSWLPGTCTNQAEPASDRCKNGNENDNNGLKNRGQS
jgi:hypothetical protein